MADNFFRIQFEYLRLAFKTALEYRGNFIIQTTSMILNDIIWVVFWMIFFSKINQVNGWNIKDLMLLYSVITIAYGINGVFFGNRKNIAKFVSEGKLDFYLTLPQPVLGHVLVSHASWYALGDLIFGIAIACFVITPAQIPLFAVLLLLSSTIMLSYSLLLGSLSFFIGNSEGLSNTLNEGLIAMSSYPYTIYEGLSKIIVLFIIPAAFITGIPVELLKSFSPKLFLELAIFAVVSLGVATFVFYKGLKRYESGNLMHVRR